ncbi:dephospho-CoA kinase domain-containing protein [Centruroides vittatus]|uniref:dephospho-CoA kinase domain-containing protein n=1 Tax=Centruroides vittatus TaxID=120091 RepID=UPI00350F4458
MFLVGLTGGIATGKSTVASMFQEFGIKVIDSDVVARQVVEPGTIAWKKIKNEFGSEVILPDGMIDRQKLGKIIFSNSELRKKLNSITHPEIYKTIFWECLKLFLLGYQFVMLDLPLLYESGKMTKYIHKVVVVSCDENQQLTRLMRRNGFSEFDSLQRISAQMPLKEKCNMADFVIDNSGNYEETKKQVAEIIEKLKSSNYHWKVRFIVLSVILTLMGSVGFFVYKMIVNFS